jgi:hypothetical protein
VFLPSIPALLGYAAELESERDHVLSAPGGQEDEERALAEAQRERTTADELDDVAFQALAASAHFDRVLFDGAEFGVTAEEEDFLGLPGLLEPEQVAQLLRGRRSTERRGRPAATAGTAATPGTAAAGEVTTAQALAALRKELNALIAAWHHRTGQPHGVIHAELRRTCGGPALAQATADQIRARIARMRQLAGTGR